MILLGVHLVVPFGVRHMRPFALRQGLICKLGERLGIVRLELGFQLGKVLQLVQ
jgi:hypothetical protein